MLSQNDRKSIERLRKIRDFKIDKTQTELNKSFRLLNQSESELQVLVADAVDFHEKCKASQKKQFDQLKNSNISAEHFLEYRNLIEESKEQEKKLKQDIQEKQRLISEMRDKVKHHKNNLIMLNKKLEGLKLILSEFKI